MEKACHLKIDNEFGTNPSFLRLPFEVIKRLNISPIIKSSLAPGSLMKKHKGCIDKERLFQDFSAAGGIVGGIMGEKAAPGEGLASVAVFARICAREALRI